MAAYDIRQDKENEEVVITMRFSKAEFERAWNAAVTEGDLQALSDMFSVWFFNDQAQRVQ